MTRRGHTVLTAAVLIRHRSQPRSQNAAGHAAAAAPQDQEASAVKAVFHLDLTLMEEDCLPVSEPVLVQHMLDDLEPVGLPQPRYATAPRATQRRRRRGRPS